jgi:cellulose synthase/poly-beta-1,6-N-acetylglucosamine synthase-like glycosyltransferase
VFVDADVIIEPDALRNLLAPMVEGRAEAAIGNYTDDVAGLSFGTAYKQLYVACVYRRRIGYVINDFWTAIGAVSRSVFNTMGGFDSSFRGANGEDADLGIRMARNGYRILAVPDVLGQHRHEQTVRGIVANDWRKGVMALRQCQTGQRALTDNLHATKRDIAAVLLAAAALVSVALCLGLSSSGALFGCLMLLLLYAGARADLLSCFHKQGFWFLARSFPTMLSLDLLRAVCAAQMVLARSLSYGRSFSTSLGRPAQAPTTPLAWRNAQQASLEPTEKH